ncbi:hypothetical protein A4X03_0g8171 [Tilletia caries]|nr:hypothetical protein A4X03_0g8171 [Tilletia caries]
MVRDLEEGFSFGIPPIRVTTVNPNHAEAEEDLDILQEIVDREVDVGRVLAPLSLEEVEERLGCFQTSPLGLVPKPGGKFRMIQDFSFPRKAGPEAAASINAYIDSDEFVCGWDGFTAMVDQIRDSPKGSYAAMSDAQEAFRAIKAHPSQLPGLFIALPKGGFGIDTRLPFGLASATRVWGSVADLVKMLITSTMPALRVIKWVDDFVFIKPPDSTITLKDIHQATEVLGFPWHPVKQSDFDSKVTYLGFIWDLHAMTVKLPDSKREAFSLRASAFLSSSPRSLKEVRETCGALQHVASMARDLAPFLAEFFAFMKAWESKEPYHRLHVPAQVQDEAKVWVRALRHEMVRSIAMPSKEFPHVLYVDASTTWGVGVTCDDRWAAWMLLSGWDADGRGIGWAEAAALELGVRQAVAMGASDCVLRIFSDNKGVIGAFRKGRSRGRSANSIMRSLIAFAMQHHLDVRVTYVATDVNPADAPSRGQALPGPHLSGFDTPAPLRPFLHATRRH